MFWLERLGAREGKEPVKILLLLVKEGSGLWDRFDEEPIILGYFSNHPSPAGRKLIQEAG